MNIDLEIDFYKEKFAEMRKKLMHSILDAIHDEETFWKYYPKLHGVLQKGYFVSNCPENLKLWLRQEESRGTVKHFDDLLESLEEYRENPSQLVEYFGSDGVGLKKILEEHSTWELMQEVIEYTLKHEVCGTTFDW